MKKLLTISVLAATLASAAVFAQPMSGDNGAPGMGKPGMGKPGMGKPGMGNNGPDMEAPVLLIADGADQGTVKGFKIAQTLVDALAGSGNKAKKAMVMFDKDGGFDQAEIMFAMKVTSENVNAVQEATLAAVRLANQQLGWNGIIANPGKGNEIVKIYAISHIDGDNTVKAVVAKLADGGKKVVIVTTAVDEATVSKLEKAKAAAALSAVKGK